MLHVEDNLNENGLPHVCIVLFRCLWVPGGGLEPFRQILPSGNLLPLKRNERQATTGATARTQSFINSTKMV